MGEMILALERNGHTYRRDGSIYFKIASLATYGRLARLDHDGLQAGARVDVDEYSKDDARDFVLWKAAKDGEPTWDFGTGPGRPGWHIECSAMALRLLDGPPIDIHAGGVDLIFPHHENEIAQAEGATDADVLALLDSRRASLRREREDVEVARERLQPPRRPRPRPPRVVAAVSAAVVALPQAAELHLGRDGAGRGIAAADGGFPGAAGRPARGDERHPQRSSQLVARRARSRSRPRSRTT